MTEQFAVVLLLFLGTFLAGLFALSLILQLLFNVAFSGLVKTLPKELREGTLLVACFFGCFALLYLGFKLSYFPGLYTETTAWMWGGLAGCALLVPGTFLTARSVKKQRPRIYLS